MTDVCEESRGKLKSPAERLLNPAAAFPRLGGSYIASSVPHAKGYFATCKF